MRLQHSIQHVMVGLTFCLSTSLASAATLHVWQDSPSPAPPYADWVSAARTIQEAVDVATEGDTVLVTNGVYSTGGRAVQGTVTNRVAVDRGIILLSVNGPEMTVIEGQKRREVAMGMGPFVASTWGRTRS
jgi:hypothetical protein